MQKWDTVLSTQAHWMLTDFRMNPACWGIILLYEPWKHTIELGVYQPAQQCCLCRAGGGRLHTLNGRSSNGKANFTVISTVGKSVVDYVIVQAEQFHNYSEFEVKTVLDVLENFSIPSDSPMPDHSLVCWEYTYTDPLLNRLSQQICCAQPKSISHAKNYSWDPYKPHFKYDTSVHSLEELITELDSQTPSSKHW